jgi:hypothetical protein
MLHERWALEAVSNKFAPLLQADGFLKTDSAVFECLPLKHDTVTVWAFDSTLQFHGTAALSLPENGLSFLHTGLELGFAAGLYVDLRNLQNGVASPSRTKTFSE